MIAKSEQHVFGDFLVHPYFIGTGENRSLIEVYHENVIYKKEDLLNTNKGDMLRVIEPSVIIEDLFENIMMTKCQLVSQNPDSTINNKAEFLYGVVATSYLKL